ncbi:MAG: acyltransferase [Ruthenibacterium sp.]
MPIKRERIFYLDLIRAVAFFCIVTIHFNAEVSQMFVLTNHVFSNHVLGSIYLGDFGVSLFFMISGAALMYVNGETCKPLKTFYWKRFKSLYPMFWLAWIIAFCTLFMINKSINDGAQLWTILLTVLGMDGYTFVLGAAPFGYYILGEWFLGCIVLLYLIYPLLSYMLNKKPWLTCIFFLGVYIILSFYFMGIFFLLRIPEMLFGMLFMKYIRKPKPIHGGIAIVVLFISMCLRQYLRPLTYCVLASACVFTLLALLAGWVKNISVQKIFQVLSKYSYAAFLIHHVLITAMIKGFDLPSLTRKEVWLLYFIYLVLTGILSYGLYHLNERVLKAASRFYSARKENKSNEGVTENAITSLR